MKSISIQIETSHLRLILEEFFDHIMEGISYKYTEQYDAKKKYGRSLFD